MTDTGIYGSHLPRMEAVKDKLFAVIENTRRELTEKMMELDRPAGRGCRCGGPA